MRLLVLVLVLLCSACDFFVGEAVTAPDVPLCLAIADTMHTAEGAKTGPTFEVYTPCPDRGR